MAAANALCMVTVSEGSTASGVPANVTASEHATIASAWVNGASFTTLHRLPGVVASLPLARV